MAVNYPDALLYASLLEAEPYLINDARSQTWATLYDRAIKNITNDTSKNFQIPKKTIKKLIRVYHKQNFSEEVATHEEFETLYETVTKVS